MNPNQCAILSVDPGAISGWALTVRGDYIKSGEVRPERELGRVREVCEYARICAEVACLPLVLVLERPFRGRGGSAGASNIHTWQAVAREAGIQASKVVKVYTATWRAAVLGRGWGNKPREVARERERQFAEGLACSPLGPDEAPAVCLGQWGAYCDEVNAKLPKKFRRVEAA